MGKAMSVELRCRWKGCVATSARDTMFDGVNVEHGWTYWRDAELLTCPGHYEEGHEMNRIAGCLACVEYHKGASDD